MPPEALFDIRAVDYNRVVVDKEAIRKVNPQRFEMEQLDAIVYLDRAVHLVIGYKDVRADEFWVRGHMPGFPLMPGVLICEAAAQLTGWYWMSTGRIQGDFVAFGGMENVRFRGPVHVGDRLVLIAKGEKFDRRRVVMQVQGFVDGAMVFHGEMIGVPFKKSEKNPKSE
jgi:3-hydroxyacyl-[acyl-carrier-protein] dehydratase